MPIHSIMLQLKNNHLTRYCLLEFKHTQLLYLNMGNKACHAILHFVREAALEFNFYALNWF